MPRWRGRRHEWRACVCNGTGTGARGRGAPATPRAGASRPRVRGRARHRRLPAPAHPAWQTPPVTPRAPSSPDLAVWTDGLGRRFGERWAVRDLSLELQRGEVFGLLGPNGAGKTTTIRLLAALIAPSAGQARVDGLDLAREADGVRARVGVLTEAPGLCEKLSAARNLDFFGKLQGLAPAVRAERIERLLRLFDLWDRRLEPTGTFSKGMKQKLAIARALLHDPPVLFLDEPTAALDPEAAAVGSSRKRTGGSWS